MVVNSHLSISIERFFASNRSRTLDHKLRVGLLLLAMGRVLRICSVSIVSGDIKQLGKMHESTDSATENFGSK
jgi:hypothetical protein